MWLSPCEPELTAAGSLGASPQTPSVPPTLFFQTLLSQDEMLNDSRFLTPTFEDWRWCSSMTKNSTCTSCLQEQLGALEQEILPLLCLCHLPRSISCCQCSHTLQLTLLCAVFPHHAVGNMGEERDSCPKCVKSRLAMFCSFIQLPVTRYVDVQLHGRSFVIFYFYN